MGPSSDKRADFGFRETDQCGQLTESEPILLPELLSQLNPLPGIQPTRIAGSEQLLADVSADLPGFQVFHGYTSLLCHPFQHSCFPLLGAGHKNAKTIVCYIDGFKPGNVHIVCRKDYAVADQPMIWNRQRPRMKDFPSCPCSQRAKRSRLTNGALFIKTPNWNKKAFSKHQRSRTLGIIIRHHRFSVFRGLDDCIDRHIAEILIIITDGIQLTVKNQVRPSFSCGRSIVAIKSLEEDLEPGTTFLRPPKQDMWMAVFDGEGNNDDMRIGRADADQIERGIIVVFADNEIPGVGAVGAHMKKSLFHR